MRLAVSTASAPLFSFQNEQVETYLLLGQTRGDYFALLDRVVYDDDFFDLLGSDCVNKLAGRGGHKYANVGELISDSLRDVVRKCNLTVAESSALSNEIGRLGLRFEADTSAWLSYRFTKPSDFRLLQLEVLNSHSARAVRRCFSRSPCQLAPKS